MSVEADLGLVERLANKLADWKTWAALWIGMVTWYSYKHSAQIMELIKVWVENRNVQGRLKTLEDENRQLKKSVGDLTEARRLDAASIGELRAEIVDLRRRNGGLARAFVLARHGVIDVPDPAH